MWKRLAADPFVRLFGLAMGPILAVYVIPIFSVEQRKIVTAYWSEIALLLVSISAVLWGRERLQHTDERRFWTFVGLAHVFYLSSFLLYLWEWEEQHLVALGLSDDFLNILYYAGNVHGHVDQPGICASAGTLPVRAIGLNR